MMCWINIRHRLQFLATMLAYVMIQIEIGGCSCHLSFFVVA
jgi:hypothetical protein